MRALIAVSIVVSGALGACRQADAPVRRFALVGQVVAVAPERSEITIKHEDIQNFMPGMTMPFKVQDPALLKDRRPGDLVTAMLVVGETEAYLSAITKTGSASVADPPPAPIAAGLKPGDLVADAAFLDQEGGARRLSDWRGHRVALTLVYTRCPLPEFCPLMDRHFGVVQRAMASSPQFADVRLLTITMDPSFDTPAVLKTHAAGLKADLSTWSFLTPRQEGAAAFFEQFGLIVEREGAGADITHNLRTVVLDAEGRVSAVRTGNDWTAAQLIGDLKATPPPKG
jgi:protein SCO1/2